MADRISESSSYIYDQLWNQARGFTADSVVLDKSTDITDNVQLVIFIKGIYDLFEVTEDFVSLLLTHVRSTAKDLFQQLLGAIERNGLQWNRRGGNTTDGAPSMTGKEIDL